MAHLSRCLPSGQLPAFIIGWLADYPDPHNIFTYFHSNGVYGTTQGQAFIDFARENLDSLVEKAIAETDEAERQKLYEEIQTIAYEDALGITLYQRFGNLPHERLGKRLGI